MAPTKLRKWTSVEDMKLISSVNEYLSVGSIPDYRMIAKRINHRSPKQCRERYENSLQPDVKRGEWSFDETLILAQLMTSHGQNWAAVKDQLKTRTYNAIKKKGRKLLGEIVDRNSIPKGNSSKATSNWSGKEFKELLKLHLNSELGFEKQNNYLNLALTLRTGRSEAEIERKLVQNCNCSECSSIKRQIADFAQTDDDFMPDIAGFKERWSLWKSNEVVQDLQVRGPKKTRFKSTRRASTISTSSDATMATQTSKRIKYEEDEFSVGTTMSVHETFFPFEKSIMTPTTEIVFNMFPKTPTTEQQFSWPILQNPFAPQAQQSISSQIKTEEFDLSFLFPV